MQIADSLKQRPDGTPSAAFIQRLKHVGSLPFLIVAKGAKYV